MNSESVQPTNARVVGQVNPILSDEGKALFADTGSTVVVIAYYNDDTKQQIDRLCLYNLGPGIALIHRLSLIRDDRVIATDILEKIEPGAETLWFNLELLQAWIASFTTEQQGTFGGMTGAAGQWDLNVAVHLTTQGLRGTMWPIRLTRQLEGTDSYSILNPGNTRTLNF